jgi:hypothetical protein
MHGCALVTGHCQALIGSSNFKNKVCTIYHHQYVQYIVVNRVRNSSYTQEARRSLMQQQRITLRISFSYVEYYV